MSEPVRLGGCAAGWGDLRDAAIPMVEQGVDFLGYDFLSELSLPMLAKRRARDGDDHGHVPGVVARIEPTLDAAGAGRTCVVTNAGGLNPLAARREVARELVSRGWGAAPVGAVTGDDVLDRLGSWAGRGLLLDDPASGMSYCDIADRVVYANAYLGAAPVATCITEGARVVTAGRVTDSALFLGPLLAAFGWTELDKVATGFIVGHLLECSGQVTGGASNFWRQVDRPWVPGYPVAEVSRDGGTVITKPDGTGGLVSRGTVIEQLLYEVQDPACYISPDVTADITDVEVEQVAEHRVSITGVRGHPPPGTAKVVVGYRNGFIGTGSIMFSWPDALQKARRAEEIVRYRLTAEGVAVEELHVERIGVDALHGPTAPEPDPDEVNEVMLRFTARCPDRASARAISEQMLPLFLLGPATPAGLGAPQPVRESVSQLSILVPAELIAPSVHVAPASEAAEDKR